MRDNRPGDHPDLRADLASKGYRVCFSHSLSISYILPPVCDIPEGPFLMGSNPEHDLEARADEFPQHTVSLPSFSISTFPLTVDEYACFLTATHYPPPVHVTVLQSHPTIRMADWSLQRMHTDYPVVGLRYNDATQYATWFSAVTGQQWRLPTEAEWEKAARGSDGRIYPWGNTWNAANVNCRQPEDSSKKPSLQPIGRYPLGKSPYGVEEMAGTVMEWTSSPWSEYLRDSEMPAQGQYPYIQRGGGWLSHPKAVRTACRIHNIFENLVEVSGMRLVRQ